MRLLRRYAPRNDTGRSMAHAKKQYYVYLLTNKGKTVLYTGVTNDLIRRAYEHKEKLVDGFTRRYNVDRLVYYETCGDIEGAIDREKQIKAGSRKKKEQLVNAVNPQWQDLSQELLGDGRTGCDGPSRRQHEQARSL